MAIEAGTLESGLVQADIAFWAYNGDKAFDFAEKTGKKPERFTKLRAIANLYPETIHIVVRRDAKIESIGDLPVDAGGLLQITAICEDAAGELHLVSRLGSIYRLVPEPHDAAGAAVAIGALACAARRRDSRPAPG